MVAQRTFISRFLDPVTAQLPPDALRRMLDFRFDDETQAWAVEMAAKANRGELSEPEREEYFEYLDAVDVIAVMQLRARRLLGLPQPT
jgi:hypothetical protein